MKPGPDTSGLTAGEKFPENLSPRVFLTDIKKPFGKQFFCAFSATGIEIFVIYCHRFYHKNPHNLPKGAGGGTCIPEKPSLW